MEKFGNNRPQQIEEMAKKASINGVAVYAIDAAQIDSELGADSNVQVD